MLCYKSSIENQRCAGSNVHVVHWTNRDSSLQDSYTMALVVYNARRQVFVQECAYLFLIAAWRQKQNVAFVISMYFWKWDLCMYYSFSFFFQGYARYILHICPIQMVSFTLISNSATNYIQKRRGEPGVFSFEYNLLQKLISK